MSSAGGLLLVLSGIVLAPLLPGLVQWCKARLQGRRGASPLQPYRELRRLWSRSAVDPAGTTWIYRLAPPLVAGATLVALFLLPLPGAAPAPFGTDALVLVGLLALARFAIATAAWDTGGGFGLMGAARDLTIALFVEGLLLMALVLAGLGPGSTDLRAMAAAAAAASTWQSPATWAALVAFALVAVAETGRQPVDNPDTHLELTMIHEGPLLEYAGRDLALLQWTAAARHWIVLVLGAEVFLPHPGSGWARALALAAALPALCAGLALAETLNAKMRILLVPRLLAVGAAIGAAGAIGWYLVR